MGVQGTGFQTGIDRTDVRSSLSKHFAMMGVGATWRKSLRAIAVECFDTGTVVVVVLKLVETTAWARDRLKMVKKTFCSAQVLSTQPGIPSGPAAFRTFTLLGVAQTSEVESERGSSPGGRSTLRVTSFSARSKPA